MEIYKNLSLEDIEGEIWKDIEGYEGLYQVSSMGRVKSLNYNHTKKPRILKQALSEKGYCLVSLVKDKQRKTKTIHILVAKSFIPNPEGKPTVDHINNIKTDNMVCNLRWATAIEQMRENEITRARHKKLVSEWGKKNIKKAIEAKKKRVKCLTTGKIFDSIAEAGKYYKINNGHICDCCKGKRKTCGGMEWEYID